MLFLLCCWTNMVHLYSFYRCCFLFFYQFTGSAGFRHFLVSLMYCRWNPKTIQLQFAQKRWLYYNNMFDSNFIAVDVFDQVDIIMWRLATCSMGDTMWSGSWAGVTSPLCGWPGTSSKMAPQLMSSWDLYFMNMVFIKTNKQKNLGRFIW